MTDKAAQIIKLLQLRNNTFAAAESCTGGSVIRILTEVPGSSLSVWGGVTAYSDDAKVKILGVSAAVLEQYGAVSSQTAVSMAQGIKKISGAEWTAAVTGIAGPTGGSAEKPVGTVWLAWCNPSGEAEAKHFFFTGNRNSIREKAVAEVLNGLLFSLDA
ncbi:MAG: hypothetical protein B0D92_01920 [Spirochaeta sp. LUC14_002_19_P3]|nr:MAG: hypothetical protein B0D92_01920 [Spirochaeta sp. LUC14_002_19_P3]